MRDTIDPQVLERAKQMKLSGDEEMKNLAIEILTNYSYEVVHAEFYKHLHSGINYDHDKCVLCMWACARIRKKEFEAKYNV